MRIKALCGVLCMLLLTACAQVPRPSTYPYSVQQQMQAAHHWEVLARQVVGELIANVRAGYVSEREPVYIQNRDRSPFGRAFHTFLRTELNKQNIAVSDDVNNPLQIKWTVQPVVHHADRIKPPFPLESTLFGGLAYALGQAWDKLSLEQAGAVTAFGVLPLLDLWRGTYTGPLPHSEVIITTEIENRAAFLRRNSNIFYINDQDRQHYWLTPSIEAPVVQKIYTVVNQ
jgi:hypothetical protein